MNRLNIALTRRGLLAAGAAGTAAAAGISSSASAQTASSATASTARKGFDAAAKNGAKFAPEPLPIQDAQGLKLTHTFSLGESTLSRVRLYYSRALGCRPRSCQRRKDHGSDAV